MLSALIWVPVLGAAIIGFLPGSMPASRARSLALAVTSGITLWTLVLLSQFDISQAGMQFSELVPWIETLGLNYGLGVDGLSLPLVALAGLLTWIAIYSTSESIARPRLYYALLLLIYAGVVGGFLAQNLLLFVLFYEVELIPFYLLIAIWGGTNRRGYAAMKFLIYTAVSGILILAGFLGITWLTGSSSFDYNAIATQGLPLKAQLILLTVLLVGFGIKIPLVPLHTWLPDAYTEASPPVAILLGGILAKLGTYGLVRFGLGLFPETWALVAPGLAIVGAISAVYGAVTAIAQKTLNAWLPIVQLDIWVRDAGTAAATQLSVIGAVAQMVAHGLILAILFNLVGVIEAKAGTRELDVLNGLMSPIRGLPLTSSLLVLGGMASAGIPGMAGFVAEFLVLQGSFSVFPLPTLVCVVCTGLTAVYFVILINRTCFGRLDNNTAYYPRVTWTEKLPALVLTVVIFFLGIQPTWLVRWSETTTTAMVTAVRVNSQQQIATSINS